MKEMKGTIAFVYPEERAERLFRCLGRLSDIYWLNKTSFAKWMLMVFKILLDSGKNVLSCIKTFIFKCHICNHNAHLGKVSKICSME